MARSVIAVWARRCERAVSHRERSGGATSYHHRALQPKQRRAPLKIRCPAVYVGHPVVTIGRPGRSHLVVEVRGLIMPPCGFPVALRSIVAVHSCWLYPGVAMTQRLLTARRRGRST